MDFVGGGIAGALEGAPHVPTDDGAIGAPAFAESEEFFRTGFVFLAVLLAGIACMFLMVRELANK